MRQPLLIADRREVFWDNYLIDEEKTTTFLRLMQPIRKETCFWFDQGSEEEFQVSFSCIVKDEAGYKLYYLPWHPTKGSYVAVIESKDGLNWYKPQLNIYDHPELADNNVVMDHIPDGTFVFYDTNPDCPLEERYKATAKATLPDENGKAQGGLWCFTSPDGYHFKPSHVMTVHGTFDSINTVHWDGEKYICYLRNFHNIPGGVMTEGITDYNVRHQVTLENLNKGIRDIRVMYSKDFHDWTEPKLISFTDGKDIPLYINNMIPYERAPHVKIGFPVRYCERLSWTLNEEQMASASIKKRAMVEDEPRSGLAVTDCIFMCSHDGEMWHRYNEAFLTSEYEEEHNWVYGDCYAAYNLIDSGRENFYLYAKAWHMSFRYPKPLYRYEIRKDGFACCMADGEERVLTTKPLVFTGRDLHLNFSTSAFGYIYVEVLDEEGNPLSDKKSFEIYGDTIDRRICFADGSDFSAFAGKPVRLKFTMRDAKLYSMKFE